MRTSESKIMKRTTTNFAVDALAYLSLLGLAGTGLLIRWVLPPGTGHRYSVWGLTRHDWGDVHFYFVIAFAALVMIHLVLHWSWICAASRRLASSHPRGKQRGIGLAIVLGTLTVFGPAVFLWSARSNVIPVTGGPTTRVTESFEPKRGQGRGRDIQANKTQGNSDTASESDDRDDRPRQQRRRRLGRQAAPPEVE